jgi:octaheme c-type cytochrome (tetrathionate reductase family)
MKKSSIVLLIIISISFLITLPFLKRSSTTSEALVLLKTKYAKKHQPSVDHSKFAVLQKKFSAPHEITEACLSCHTERGKEVMQSSHWNWEREEYVKGRGIVYIGKKNAINNFCIGVEGNEQSCAKCHIGYGVTNKAQGYTDMKNIDCLICHDNTGTYKKAVEKAGLPDESLDLNKIAQHPGRPQRTNCGTCHFFGGGGNNVKHGDLEETMFDPTKEIDVHMASSSSDLQCADCHVTVNHKMAGKMYSLSSMNRNRSTCEQCHTDKPHKDNIINGHIAKVACQTCHIPMYAKGNATKMEWDWSTAGRLKNGEPYEEDDKDGNHTYMSIKGSFKWAKNVKPDYIWFNGTASHYLLGDKIKDTNAVLEINTLNGSYTDADSKIYPVKIHKARQIFDPVNMILIQPKLFAEKKGEGAYWKDFDWNTAAQKGMDEVGLPYSGKYSFINTRMYWPVNHMVAPKEESVSCNECHTRENGRLAQLTGFYLPGRDYSSVLDFFGKLLIILTLAGVITHGTIRFVSHRKLNRD